MLNDYIRRSDVLKLFDDWGGGFAYIEVETDGAIKDVNNLPSLQSERMTNKDWIDFLSEQFNVSRTSARAMLHGLIRCKAEDNFKKRFSGGNDGPIQ